MSFDVCKTCRNVGYCTFPKNRVITECDEYEDMDAAPALDWNLMQILASPVAVNEQLQARPQQS